MRLLIVLLLVSLAPLARADTTWTYTRNPANNDDAANVNGACWATATGGAGLGPTILLLAPLPKSFSLPPAAGQTPIITNPADYGPGKTAVIRCVSYRTGTLPTAPVGPNRSAEVSDTYTFPAAPLLPGSLSRQ